MQCCEDCARKGIWFAYVIVRLKKCIYWKFSLSALIALISNLYYCPMLVCFGVFEIGEAHYVALAGLELTM